MYLLGAIYKSMFGSPDFILVAISQQENVSNLKHLSLSFTLPH